LKEKLYTIPVNEAFDYDCECPLCYMKKLLEEDAIEFAMGASYMESDIREETNKTGFCSHHLSMLYENQNRLGLALVLKTHMDKTIKDIEKLSSKNIKLSSQSLFHKKLPKSPITSYINQLDDSCFICNNINRIFERYILTVYSLYKKDSSFREKFSKTKGFCTTHYGLLYDRAPAHLKNELLNNFIKELNSIYLDNMKRVRDDLEWFINKFDYRNRSEPWKNSKDALPRAITKTNGIY
jgi:uncharacterized protein DUF6062